jgi:hypothetical protein
MMEGERSSLVVEMAKGKVPSLAEEIAPKEVAPLRAMSIKAGAHGRWSVYS